MDFDYDEEALDEPESIMFKTNEGHELELFATGDVIFYIGRDRHRGLIWTGRQLIEYAPEKIGPLDTLFLEQAATQLLAVREESGGEDGVVWFEEVTEYIGDAVYRYCYEGGLRDALHATSAQKLARHWRAPTDTELLQLVSHVLTDDTGRVWSQEPSVLVIVKEAATRGEADGMAIGMRKRMKAGNA
jgi:hypothetical protein